MENHENITPELWGERNAQRVASPVTNEERNDHERFVR